MMMATYRRMPSFLLSDKVTSRAKVRFPEDIAINDPNSLLCIRLPSMKRAGFGKKTLVRYSITNDSVFLFLLQIGLSGIAR